MCLRCQGWSDAEMLDHYRALINQLGWAVVQVTGLPTLAYTVGLTRFHGHPELVVSGMAAEHAPGYLEEFGALVAGGRRFTAGEVQPGPGRHRSQFLPVDDPRQLVVAQAIYARPAPVEALQVVFSDHSGRWPWIPGWRGCAGEATQPLLGTPLPE